MATVSYAMEPSARRLQVECENGNVVFLAEALRGIGDLLSRPKSETEKTLETVKLTVDLHHTKSAGSVA